MAVRRELEYSLLRPVTSYGVAQGLGDALKIDAAPFGSDSDTDGDALIASLMSVLMLPVTDASKDTTL